jgi:hypothetical protein
MRAELGDVRSGVRKMRADMGQIRCDFAMKSGLETLRAHMIRKDQVAALLAAFCAWARRLSTIFTASTEPS